MEDSYPVSDLCEAFDVSRAGFYSWRQRGPSERDRADAALSAEIDGLFVRHRRTYGSPRLHRALRRAGHASGRHRVARLMRGRGISGKALNQLLSRYRVTVEHAICGIKRCRIVLETFRGWRRGLVDEVMMAASGLQNLRVRTRQPA